MLPAGIGVPFAFYRGIPVYNNATEVDILVSLCVLYVLNIASKTNLYFILIM